MGDEAQKSKRYRVSSAPADWPAPKGLEPIGKRRHGDTLIVTTKPRLAGTPQACVLCHAAMVSHGERAHTYADVPYQGLPVRLEVIRPRYRCQSCSVTATQPLPALNDSRRITRRLAKYLRAQVGKASLRALGKATGLAPNTVRNIAMDEQQG